MGFLDNAINEQYKKAVKGQFNIAAMELLIEAGEDGCTRRELVNLNIMQRLENEFGAENIDVDNDVAQQTYIGEVMKTSKMQAEAYITQTNNHRRFNGWAAKNDIMYVMKWTANKSKIWLEASEVAGVDTSKIEASTDEITEA